MTSDTQNRHVSSNNISNSDKENQGPEFGEIPDTKSQTQEKDLEEITLSKTPFILNSKTEESRVDSEPKFERIEIIEIQDPSVEIPFYEYKDFDLTYSMNEKYARKDLDEPIGVEPTEDRNVFPLSTCYSCKLGKKPPPMPKYLSWELIQQIFNGYHFRSK